MLAGLVIIVFKSIFRVFMSCVNLLYFGYFRPFYKRMLRQITYQCEIERVLSLSKLSMAAKIRKLEVALLHSKQYELRGILETLTKFTKDDGDEKLVKLAETVVEIKGIPVGDRREFVEAELVIIFRMILGHRFLVDLVESERSTSYDSSDPEHEKLLLKLWSILKPEEELKERISRQWTEIGFQGDDPATDFRGMGILGLQQLAYFGEYRSERAQQLLSKSNHPTKGYPFAIVGISMTSLARDLLREGALRNHFFNTIRRAPQLEDFHRVYCELFSIFDCFWTKMNPPTIMEFTPIRSQFHNALRTSLSDTSAILQGIEPSEGLWTIVYLIVGNFSIRDTENRFKLRMVVGPMYVQSVIFRSLQLACIIVTLSCVAVGKEFCYPEKCNSTLQFPIGHWGGNSVNSDIRGQYWVFFSTLLLGVLSLTNLLRAVRGERWECDTASIGSFICLLNVCLEIWYTVCGAYYYEGKSCVTSDQYVSSWAAASAMFFILFIMYVCDTGIDQRVNKYRTQQVAIFEY